MKSVPPPDTPLQGPMPHISPKKIPSPGESLEGRVKTLPYRGFTTPGSPRLAVRQGTPLVNAGGKMARPGNDRKGGSLGGRVP